MANDRAYAPPVVDELLEGAIAAQKKKKKKTSKSVPSLTTRLERLRMFHASLLMDSRRILEKY